MTLSESIFVDLSVVLCALQCDRLLGHRWIGPRPVFVIDVSGSMVGLKLACLLENLVQLLRPGGQIHMQTTAFGILATMGGTVVAFPAALSRPLGAQLRPTSDGALEEAIDWVCSWRAGGGSRVEEAVGTALAVCDATEVVLLADQCPTRGVPMASGGKHQAQQRRPINTVAFGGDLGNRRFLIQVLE